ncbi:integrase [Mycobacterium sp. IEC1808]|uniref:tyrosine-type recombinase/integrase n=1 Tax=Mycobacterium sp. IEC1808 TaxID=1743230 RepID=UPI000A166FC8|nr:site-specific integrase [Mycobacterium sp. IEC1808]ORW86916.1 integrase [Mycobacterium sp. IEC1808]
MRRTRSGIEDRWYRKSRDEDGTTRTVPSANYEKGKRYRARYVDDRGREHAKGFDLKREAQVWLNSQVSTVVTGSHVAPRDATMTVQQWCDEWIEGYKINRDSTVGTTATQLRVICAEFGGMQLSAVRPSHVKAWLAKLKADGRKASYIYVLHGRLNQIMADAVYDGRLGRNPCSKKTSPPQGEKKPYVATTEQVWQIYDAMPDNLKVAVLLGAFAGLRVAEVSGLRVSDVDFIRGVVHPKQQWAGAPLKTPASEAPIPVPQDMALMLSASVQRYPSDMMVVNKRGKPCGPWIIDDAVQKVRGEIEGLPEKFVFHDFRHYFASLLIADGADVKTVQARMRHEHATTTLNTYAHLWPDTDESTRTTVAKVFTARVAADAPADGLRTDGAV